MIVDLIRMGSAISEPLHDAQIVLVRIPLPPAPGVVFGVMLRASGAPPGNEAYRLAPIIEQG
jgi:hypothetical protein